MANTVALEKIHSLIGAHEFKALCDECASVAPEIVKYNTFTAFHQRSYLFSINEGYGLTTSLKLFGELLTELGLFKVCSEHPVAEVRLTSPHDKISGEELFAAVRPHLRSFGQDGGKIVCIDISEWMTRISTRVFRSFLARLEDFLDTVQFVFRVPYVEKEVLTDIKKGLGDILYVTDVTFAPLSVDELLNCASTQCERMGFTLAEDALGIIETRISEEKSDGKFYGINTVYKIICETVYLKHLNTAYGGQGTNVIHGNEITTLAASYEKDKRGALSLLDDYVGMENIKARLLEIVAQIETSLKNNSLERPCIHMRFVGNPGTGKTSAARILGKILKERGVLRNGNFFEYSGRDFCGRFIGETAPKTAGMCRDAYGSVLFIDEAYSLYSDDGASRDFGREALDTLIAEMENHRTDLVVIMAGYPEEMEKLMRGNAGLESRMPYIIEFPNYTRDQLFRIFISMAKKTFKFDAAFEEAVLDYFNALPTEAITSKTFSNARFVRNLFERTWGKAVMRAQLGQNDELCLTREDFIMASSEREFKKTVEKKSRPMGFGV